MYSYEERLRAVKLFLRTGKNCKATIRQLGYPTKNALKVWCADFEQNVEVLKRYRSPVLTPNELTQNFLQTRKELRCCPLALFDARKDEGDPFCG